MTLQHDSINLSSAVGLGLIGIDEDNMAVEYGCMLPGSFIYASRLCKKIVGINPSYEKLKTLQNVRAIYISFHE